MRISLALTVVAGLWLAGCAQKQEAAFHPLPAPAAGAPAKAVTASAPQPAPNAPGTLTVTPASILVGKVSRYNEAGRFTVLEFSGGVMPALEQRLFVYRNDLKVGELKVTGPQRDTHIVADLTSGEAQAGDEVREK